MLILNRLAVYCRPSQTIGLSSRTIRAVQSYFSFHTDSSQGRLGDKCSVEADQSDRSYNVRSEGNISQLQVQSKPMAIKMAMNNGIDRQTTTRVNSSVTPSVATKSNTPKKRAKQEFITVSPSAVRRLKYLGITHPEKAKYGIKISLTRKGCSGLAYSLKWLTNDKEILPFDQIIQVGDTTTANNQAGNMFSGDTSLPLSMGQSQVASTTQSHPIKVRIIIDSKALMALLGTQMDFIQTEIGSQFVFHNPNEKGRCGCGESFMV